MTQLFIESIVSYIVFCDLFINKHANFISYSSYLRPHYILLLCSSFQENKFEQQVKQTAARRNVVNQQAVPSEKKSSNAQIPDAMVRQLMDQLILAKVFLGIGPIRVNPLLVRELRLRIKEVQRTLGEATKDSDLPKQ